MSGHKNEIHSLKRNVMVCTFKEYILLITNNIYITCCNTAQSITKHTGIYCKAINFGVLLYLVNLANCVFSLIFVAPKYVNYVDRTLHRQGDAKFNSRQNLLIYSNEEN